MDTVIRWAVMPIVMQEIRALITPDSLYLLKIFRRKKIVAVLLSIAWLVYYLKSYCTMSIEIPENSLLYRQVLDFCAFASRKRFRKSLVTRQPSGIEDECALETNPRNFLREKIKKPLDYEPGYDDWWRFGLFVSLKRIRKTEDRRDYLRLHILGPFLAPGELFLQQAMAYYLETHADHITVQYPRADSRIQNYDAAYAWGPSIYCPGKPMHTVCLNQTSKDRLLDDIEYFHSPGRKQDYSKRGTPYRRNYLFWGSPGTGKTSLSKALAMHFGLRMYLINIMDQDLLDSSLQKLFSSVSGRCIVLLEDVDPNQLQRNEPDNTPNAKKNGRTFAGILNALDGITTPEGIITIITTNAKPQEFPDTFIRPGRVDYLVEFRTATVQDAIELFKLRHSHTGKLDEHVRKFSAAVEPTEPFGRSHAEIQGFLATLSAEEACKKWPEWIYNREEKEKEKGKEI